MDGSVVQVGPGLYRCTCGRCGNVWVSKSEDGPRTCPSRLCRSPYWNKPRVRRMPAGHTKEAPNG